MGPYRGRVMGKVVTVMNMKGGVGKTTVAMHLGGALSHFIWHGQNSSRNILLIDYDPQFNLSQAYLPAKTYFGLEEAKKTVLSVLQEDVTTLDPYKLQVPESSQPPAISDLITSIYSFIKGGRLDIVPSTLDLMYVALGRADTQVSIIEKRFQKFIDEARSKYDLVIIDCHPAGSLMTKTALTNSDHVLIPVVPERYAVRGIGLMLDFINSKKQGSIGPKPHILFNRVPRIGHSPQEFEIRTNKKFSDLCLSNTLKKYSAFAEPEGGKGFVWTSKKPYSSEATNNLLSVADEFAKKIGV
jgi:chromosome partitioning protein